MRSFVQSAREQGKSAVVAAIVAEFRCMYTSAQLRQDETKAAQVYVHLYTATSEDETRALTRDTAAATVSLQQRERQQLYRCSTSDGKATTYYAQDCGVHTAEVLLWVYFPPKSKSEL